MLNMTLEKNLDGTIYTEYFSIHIIRPYCSLLIDREDNIDDRAKNHVKAAEIYLQRSMYPLMDSIIVRQHGQKPHSLSNVEKICKIS